MEMTRRQFALSIAAASSMGASLFEPLSPLGVPRGLAPGRVTWAHDPGAVTWDGTGSWWKDANNNQAVIDRMVSNSIRGLTNQKSDTQAWSAIFHYFNSTHGRGNAGYKTGEKIAIKANLNNTTDHGTIDRLNSSPHLILSLVRGLTGPGKVPQSSITVFDSSRFIPGHLYDKIHGEFPGVVFVDHIGGDGRLKAEFKPNLHSNPQRYGARYHGRRGCLPHRCGAAERACEFRCVTLCQESVRRNEYSYRLAQECARWLRTQSRRFAKLRRIR
jgi:hypothetical protein